MGGLVKVRGSRMLTRSYNRNTIINLIMKNISTKYMHNTTTTSNLNTGMVMSKVCLLITMACHPYHLSTTYSHRLTSMTMPRARGTN